MASCVRTICIKNYQNLVIGFKVTVENVGDFFGTQCSYVSVIHCNCVEQFFGLSGASFTFLISQTYEVLRKKQTYNFYKNLNKVIQVTKKQKD